MTSDSDITTASLRAMEMSWNPRTRVVSVQVRGGADLGAQDGADLCDTIARFIGDSGKPFAILADGGGGHNTDGKYRATLSRFFRLHHETAFVAFVKIGAVLQIVVEMFRVGVGFNLQVFATDEDARVWLRTKGFVV